MARRAAEQVMQASASARFVWISPTKVRQIASLIRGKHIDEARRILAFTPKAAARDLTKVLESAVANAEHNFSIPQEELWVKSAWADEGPTWKRIQPRARGMAFLIRKRTSHMNVVLERRAPEEAPVPQAPTTRRRRSTAPGEEGPSGGASPKATSERPARRRRTQADEAEPKAKAEEPKAKAQAPDHAQGSAVTAAETVEAGTEAGKEEGES